ncbi:MAG: hypothetical protein SNJ84_04750 [Verrucomicrobiia bacterium]
MPAFFWVVVGWCWMAPLLYGDAGGDGVSVGEGWLVMFRPGVAEEEGSRALKEAGVTEFRWVTRRGRLVARMEFAEDGEGLALRRRVEGSELVERVEKELTRKSNLN